MTTPGVDPEAEAVYQAMGGTGPVPGPDDWCIIDGYYKWQIDQEASPEPDEIQARRRIEGAEAEL